jgi:Zn-finger nucleic acid-binding protein
MKCPVCKDDTLLPETLAGGPPAKKCSRCEGIWIPFEPYAEWLKTNGAAPAEAKAAQAPEPAEDVHGPKLCPECSRIMPHYRVLPDLKLYLDHCGTCGGIWFDKNEYTALETRGMVGKLSSFFTAEWQADLRGQQARKDLEQLYLEKFGAADFARLKEIRAWLDAHPKRVGLLDYLQAEDPYALKYMPRRGK